MKRISSGLAVLALSASPALAEDYPISGSISTALSTNHATFMGLDHNDPSYTRGSLSGSATYSPLEKLSLTGSMAVGRAFDVGAQQQGTNFSTTPGRTEIQDFGLTVGYGLGPFGPVSISTSLSAVVPLSEASDAVGLITALSPSIGMSVAIPGNLTFSLTGDTTYNVLENATQQLDCAQAQHLCDVLGPNGLGNPNTLWSYSGSAGLSYRPLGGLTLSTGYGIGAYSGAAEIGGAINVESGENADRLNGVVPYNEFGQVGTQFGAPRQSFSFGVSYNLGGGAPEPEDVLLGINRPVGTTDRFVDHVTVSLGMRTSQLLRTADNKGLRNPFFDSQKHGAPATSYALRVNYAL